MSYGDVCRTAPATPGLLIIHNRTYTKKIASLMIDSQIGAQRKKSVRNNICVLNAIISNVLSLAEKKHLQLTCV